MLRVTMPDGSKWDLPMNALAGRRSNPTAQPDDKTLVEWAENNLNWSDISHISTQHQPSEDVDFQEGWVNGVKEVVEV